MGILLQFFTRIPVNKTYDYSRENFRKYFWMLPLLGGMIGLVQGLVFFLMSKIFPASIAIIFALISEYLITGGLHMDGLADTADGIFSGRKGEKAYEIMKDGSIGPFGTLAMFMVLLLQYQGLLLLLSPAVFVLLGVLAKSSMLLLAYRGKPFNEKGTGEIITDNISNFTLLFTLSLVTGIFIYILGLAMSIFTSLSLLILIRIFRTISNKTIGGLNGDQYGFIHEISKVMIILILIL